MYFEAKKIYHLYNRGKNKQRIFFKSENYFYFLRKIRKHLLPHADILCYCLMPNHFHLMIYTNETHQMIESLSDISGQTTWSRPTTPKPPQIQALTRSIAILQSSYTRAIQKQENIVGSLFQQKTKAKEISSDQYSESYAFTCFNYIHQNPIKAILVDKIEDLEFSSFPDYIGLRNGTLCNQILAKKFLDIPVNKEDFYKQSYKVIDPEILGSFFD